MKKEINNKRKIVEQGNLLVNSRVFIDYTKKKPKIRFSYPDKKSTEIGGMAYAFPMLFALILVWLAGMSYDAMYANKPIIFNLCDISYSNVTNISSRIPLYVSCQDHQGKIINFSLSYINPSIWSYRKDIILKSYQGPNWLTIIISLVLMTMLWIGVPWFYKHTKLGNRLYPKLNALLDTKYYVKFTECPDNKIIEIPLFNNVVLKYKAKKEFSKYLQHVNIIDHPFDKLISKYSKKKRKLVDKKGKNIWLWKAQFIFKEVPKTGYLEVWFR